MKYCCIGLENLTKKRDKRGLSVFSVEYENSPVFFVSFHAVDKENFQEYSEVLSKHKTNFPVSIDTQNAIRCCPYCGKNLALFYNKSWREFESEKLA